MDKPHCQIPAGMPDYLSSPVYHYELCVHTFSRGHCHETIHGRICRMKCILPESSGVRSTSRVKVVRYTKSSGHRWKVKGRIYQLQSNWVHKAFYKSIKLEWSRTRDVRITQLLAMQSCQFIGLGIAHLTHTGRQSILYTRPCKCCYITIIMQLDVKLGLYTWHAELLG